MEPRKLPIELVADEIVGALQNVGRAVIAAPPGAGKSTVLPQLLRQRLSGDGKLLLLQPRRMAARAVAARIAQLTECQLGDQVGYQVRLDRRWGQQTQIVVMTYGVLLRRLQSDPFLETFDTVLLDEFHERSLEADLTLGMLRRVQRELRSELRIGVMSATLDAQPVATYLDDAPLIESHGRSFPVTIKHSKQLERGPLVPRVVSLLGKIQKHINGDVLVFLPGVGEIKQAHRALKDAPWLRGAKILELYGDLPPDKQDRVLAPSDQRKLVLATNVAETSITIDGITCVVDSGEARIMRVDANLGLPRLEVEPISQAAAAQRAGRAGRTAPGVCYRLWSEAQQRARPEFDVPEIQRGDLAGAVLQLFSWGEPDILAFPWLTPPSSSAVDAARTLLVRLGAIGDGKITTLGKQLLQVPAHPRLARLLVAGIDFGCAPLAALGAAMLSERDPMVDGRGERLSRDELMSLGLYDADFCDRVFRLQRWLAGDSDPAVIPAAGKTIRRVAEQFLRVAGDIDATAGSELSADPDASEALQRAALTQALLCAFPDRLARRRHPGSDRGLMVGETGVRVRDPSLPSDVDYFLCIDLLRKNRDADARRVVGVQTEWLRGRHRQSRDECFFHPSQRKVVGRRRHYWLDLMLEETPAEVTDQQTAAALLHQHVITGWPAAFPSDNPAVTQWIARINFAARLGVDGFATIDDAQLQETAATICQGRLSIDEVQQAPWLDFLQGIVGYENLRRLDQLVPRSLQLPSGQQADIDYLDANGPSLKARLQELFGWQDTPRIAGGRQPLLLRILAPNYREVQITKDLANFWRSTYNEVRKEMRRRYPKHNWPEDPLTAVATKGGLKPKS